MKNKIPFLVIISMALAALIALLSKNTLAGLFIGMGSGLLLIIITSLETERETRN